MSAASLSGHGGRFALRVMKIFAGMELHREKGTMDPSTAQASERDQVAYFSSLQIAELVASVAAEAGYIGQASLIELHHRPGAGVSGLFEIITVTKPAYLICTTESVDPGTPRVLRTESPIGVLHLWEHPNDPGLPGLPLASVPESVQATWGGRYDLLNLETLAYRPLRRAVLKATFDDPLGEVFLKVLRKDADLLAQKHKVLAEAGTPVPELIGDPVRDVLAIKRVAGMPMAQAIMDGRTPPVTGADIVAVLSGFPTELMEAPARPAWTDRLEWYAHAAETALPEETGRIQGLMAKINAVLETAHRGPLVANHGDFYEANIFVRDGKITGIIDIDSAGPGYLIDDLACFIGHLAVLPTLDQRYSHVPEFVRYYLTEFSSELAARSIDPQGLYARSASVVLSLIAGARDEEDPHWKFAARQRLAVAEGLIGGTQPIKRSLLAQ
ncbi:phosphotransferase [Jonesia quinghaiensis]|uniref:phosphotransferase n=1 Tax=Jonesia quinghaiensis TaxID=262806 RepID=UPI0012F84971|nr:phosphotransferase [Jonesia quinghaiensis]